MENTDILIIILMFAMPVVSALLDRRKKARKNAGQTTRRQIRQPETFKPFASDDIDFPEEEEQMDEEDPALQTEAPEGFSPKEPEEGESVISNTGKHPALESEQSPEVKGKIDVRKLIEYDAIMHPKFKD